MSLYGVHTQPVSYTLAYVCARTLFLYYISNELAATALTMCVLYERNEKLNRKLLPTEDEKQETQKNVMYKLTSAPYEHKECLVLVIS